MECEHTRVKTFEGEARCQDCLEKWKLSDFFKWNAKRIAKMSERKGFQDKICKYCGGSFMTKNKDICPKCADIEKKGHQKVKEEMDKRREAFGINSKL